jgi:hypothetical protein
LRDGAEGVFVGDVVAERRLACDPRTAVSAHEVRDGVGLGALTEFQLDDHLAFQDAEPVAMSEVGGGAAHSVGELWCAAIVQGQSKRPCLPCRRSSAPLAMIARASVAAAVTARDHRRARSTAPFHRALQGRECRRRAMSAPSSTASALAMVRPVMRATGAVHLLREIGQQQTQLVARDDLFGVGGEIRPRCRLDQETAHGALSSRSRRRKFG